MISGSDFSFSGFKGLGTGLGTGLGSVIPNDATI